MATLPWLAFESQSRPENQSACRSGWPRSWRSLLNSSPSISMRMRGFGVLYVHNRVTTRRSTPIGRHEAVDSALAIHQVILEAGTQIEQRQRQELQLQTREAALVKAVNDAEVQWTDFNARLDALEGSLPASVSRRAAADGHALR